MYQLETRFARIKAGTRCVHTFYVTLRFCVFSEFIMDTLENPGVDIFIPGFAGTAVVPPVLQCPHFFFCRQSSRQLEPPLPLIFSCKIFGHSALAPNFSIDPLFGKADMGSLVHSRACGEATAVCVIFHPDLVAEKKWKCGSRRLILPFPVL